MLILIFTIVALIVILLTLVACIEIEKYYDNKDFESGFVLREPGSDSGY